jgi:hypothetical protein
VFHLEKNKRDSCSAREISSLLEEDRSFGRTSGGDALRSPGMLHFVCMGLQGEGGRRRVAGEGGTQSGASDLGWRRSGAQIAASRCERIKNERNYYRSLRSRFDGSRWARRDFTRFHNYPRYKLTVVWTVSARWACNFPLENYPSSKIILAAGRNSRVFLRLPGINIGSNFAPLN